jgi:hypothetical protein
MSHPGSWACWFAKQAANTKSNKNWHLQNSSTVAHTAWPNNFGKWKWDLFATYPQLPVAKLLSSLLKLRFLVLKIRTCEKSTECGWQSQLEWSPESCVPFYTHFVLDLVSGKTVYWTLEERKGNVLSSKPHGQVERTSVPNLQSCLSFTSENVDSIRFLMFW